MDPHGRCADKRSQIAGDSPLHEVIQVLTERSPDDVESDVPLVLAHFFFHPLVQRPHRFAFAENFESDTLPDIALRATILDQRLGGPTEHIDKPRGDSQSLGVNLGLGAGIL